MRIAIATDFQVFMDSYALCAVVCEHVLGLRRLGHEVEVWCSLSINKPTFWPFSLIADFIVPTFGKRTQAVIEECFLQNIERFSPDVVITHDLLFQEAHREHAKAIHRIGPLTETAWMHYVHSYVVASPVKPGDECIRAVPDGHFIVYPCDALKANVASFFSVGVDRVLTCRNPRDPRTYWRTPQALWDVLDNLSILDADYVQVYPMCATRHAAKGLQEVVDAFTALHDSGEKCALVLCLANIEAGNRIHADRIQKIIQGKPFIGVIDSWNGDNGGVPNDVVSHISRYSTVFFAMSHYEASPLHLAEATMSNARLYINSKNLSLTEHAPGATRFQPYWTTFSELVKMVKRDFESDNKHAQRMNVFRTMNFDAVARRLDSLIRFVIENKCTVGQQRYNPPIVGTEAINGTNRVVV